MGQHANSYLLLFSHPYLMECLLREFVHAEWVKHLDFSSLEKVGASYATDDLRSRHDDVVWRVRGRDGGKWIYIYLLLEFQRTNYRFMAVRVMTYLGLLYEDLIKRDGKRRRYLPPVLPIVLYNGYQRWTAPTDVVDLIPRVPKGLEEFRPKVHYLLIDEGAFDSETLEAHDDPVASLFRLEHAGPDEALSAVQSLRESLPGRRHKELRRAFVIWYMGVLRNRLGDTALPEVRELEEVEIMLTEKRPTWPEIWEQRGLEQGLEKGLEKGRQEGRREGEARILLRLLDRRFGSIDATIRRRVQSADADRLLEWGDRILTAERLGDVFGD